MWPSSSSSLCSFWHRFLCWARKRNTATLQGKNKQSGIHRGWRKQKHPIYEHNIQTSHSPVVCRFLSLDLFLQVIPLLHQTLNVLTTEFHLFSGWKKHKTTETSSSVDTEKHPRSKSVRRNIFRAVIVQYVQNIRLMDFLEAIATKGK